MVFRPTLLFLLSHCFALFLVPVLAPASEYSPEGFYDVEYYRLGNGLQVVLKPRPGARNVSIRLAVGVGTHHFPCGQQELPHFLEHLLFTGTSKHSEYELDHQIESHGGSWNAATYSTRTVYEIDIFSGYTKVGLSTLQEIITDSVISSENVEISRDIIHREAGGRPSALRRWLYTQGVGVSAMTRASEVLLPNPQLQCGLLTDAAAITRDAIVDAYHRYYVPNNMVLVVVGDFAPDAMRSLIEEQFGLLAKSGFTPPKNPQPGPTKGFQTVTGRLSPILDTEGTVGLIFRTSSRESHDQYALDVLESYLTHRLFNVIRSERGLAYSPSAEHFSDDDYGLFGVFATTDLKNMGEVRDLLQEAIDEQRDNGPDTNTLEDIKRGILLGEASGVEANSDYADYYVNYSNDLNRYGQLVNYEEQIEAVSGDAVQRVAKQYFTPENSVLVWETPSLSYTWFFVLLGILGFAVLVVSWRLVRVLRFRRPSSL